MLESEALPVWRNRDRRGRVVISGNWYAPDGIEVYNGTDSFSLVKHTSVGRSSPYVLRMAHGDVLIFGSNDLHGQPLGDSAAIVDRLRGQPFSVPLLRQWTPAAYNVQPRHEGDDFIGDPSKGLYRYLLLVRDTIANGPAEQFGQPTGHAALMMVSDTIFSLLPTTYPIPQATDIGGLIYWRGPVIADRQRQRAYVPSLNSAKRLYLLCVEYNRQPAPLVIYYTDPLPECGHDTPVLTADGNLAIIGGYYREGFFSTNYEPTASAWLIPLISDAEAPASVPVVLICLLTGLFAIAAVAVSVVVRRRRRTSEIVSETAGATPSLAAAPAPAQTQALFLRIIDLMNGEQLFRNPNLKPADVATALNTNSRYVTESIRAERDLTFSQFVNEQRLLYAQQLLRQHPDRKVIEIALDAGFSSERSFFRIFKTVTGMTTQEWLKMNAPDASYPDESTAKS